MDTTTISLLIVILLTSGGVIYWEWKRSHRCCFRCAAWIRTRFSYCPECGQMQFAQASSKRTLQQGSQRPRAALQERKVRTRSVQTHSPSHKVRRTVILAEKSAFDQNDESIVPTIPGRHLMGQDPELPNVLCPECRRPFSDLLAGYCGHCGARVSRTRKNDPFP